MTELQRIAHERLSRTLPMRTVICDDERNEPANWAKKDRPPTPAELASAQRMLEQ